MTTIERLRKTLERARTWHGTDRVCEDLIINALALLDALLDALEAEQELEQ